MSSLSRRKVLSCHCDSFGQSRGIRREIADKLAVRSRPDADVARPIACDDARAVMTESDAQSEVIERVELPLHRPILIPDLDDPIAATRHQPAILRESNG